MSGASQRLNRLLALVPWLVAHNGVSIADAAAHFDITEEQLEADLWLLVVSGLPGYGHEHLVDIQFWDDGLVHVLDPQTIDRPLRLNPHEAFALQLGLRMLAQVNDDPSIASAMAKLEDAAGVGVAPAVAELEQTQMLALVNEALKEHRVIRMTYAGAATDAATLRDVEPIRVVASSDHAYIDAWCRVAEAQRTFRLDRIEHAELCDERFTPRSIQTEDSLGSERFSVTVSLDPRLRWVAEAYGTIERESEEEVLAQLFVSDPRWVVRLVLSLQGGARVIEPAGIAQAVAREAELALRAYA